MSAIAEAEIDVDPRHEIVDYADQSYASQGLPEALDLTTELREVAIATVRTAVEYQNLRRKLHDVIPPEPTDHDFIRGCTRERLLVLLTRLTECFGEKDEAERIRRENRHLSSFREQFLEAAWKQRAYRNAAYLAAYREAGEEQEACQVAREVVLSGDSEYLEELKSLVPPDEWPAARKGVIHDLLASRGFSQTVLPELFVRDNLWDELTRLVETSPHLMREYGPMLVRHFPDRARNLWSLLLIQEARSASTRSGYRRLGESIRRHAEVGEVNSATEVRDQFLLEFPQSPALRDELSPL